MKTSLLVAAAALVASSIAGSAAALDVSRVANLQVDGIGLSLGVLTFLPLGVDGPFCDYLADWYSPYNPNDVNICVLQELRTPFGPSCIFNERVDITTVVTSSPSLCAGFNLKGETLPVSLMLGESPVFGLSGVAVFGCAPLIQTYPISTIC
jgi:hypothetical protein